MGNTSEGARETEFFRKLGFFANEPINQVGWVGRKPGTTTKIRTRLRDLIPIQISKTE
jgi:hypothetical protein